MPPQKELLLKLTSMRYKKAGVSDEDFHNYATKQHAAKAAVIQARHGAVKVAQYHTPPIHRTLLQQKLPWTIRPGWKINDCDMQISVWVRKTEDMLAIVMDPEFQALVEGDEEMTDNKRGEVVAGWEEVYVEDGGVVNVGGDGESLYGGWEVGKSVGMGEGGEEGGNRGPKEGEVRF